jgi:hypothetical protein
MHHNRVHPSVRGIYVGFEFNHRIPPSVRQAGLCLRPSVFISPRPRAAFSGWPGVGTGVTRWDADHASADECFNFFLGITNFRQDCSVVLSKRRSRTTNARRGRGEPDRRSFGCTSIGRLSTSSSRSPIFPTGMRCSSHNSSHSVVVLVATITFNSRQRKGHLQPTAASCALGLPDRGAPLLQTARRKLRLYRGGY